MSVLACFLCFQLREHTRESFQNWLCYDLLQCRSAVLHFRNVIVYLLLFIYIYFIHLCAKITSVKRGLLEHGVDDLITGSDLGLDGNGRVLQDGEEVIEDVRLIDGGVLGGDEVAVELQEEREVERSASVEHT